MSQSEPSAAQALFGHLPSAARPEVEQRAKPTMAQSMYPGMPSLVPKPQPASNLAAACDENPWLEVMLRSVGIRRKS